MFINYWLFVDDMRYLYIMEIGKIKKLFWVPGCLKFCVLLARFEQENYIELVKPMTKRKVYIIFNLGKALLNDEYNRLKKMIVDFEKVRAEND